MTLGQMGWTANLQSVDTRQDNITEKRNIIWDHIIKIRIIIIIIYYISSRKAVVVSPADLAVIDSILHQGRIGRLIRTPRSAQCKLDTGNPALQFCTSKSQKSVKSWCRTLDCGFLEIDLRMCRMYVMCEFCILDYNLIKVL